MQPIQAIYCPFYFSRKKLNFREKSKFANPNISYAPSQTNKKRTEPNNVQGEPYTGDVIENMEE